MKRFICLAFLILLFCGCREQSSKPEAAPDPIPAEQLDDLAEYTGLEKTNRKVFKPIGFEGIEYIREKGLDAYLWLSYPGCSNCQECINEVAGYANKKGITLYYFNPKTFASSEDLYEKLLELLSPVLETNSEGEKKIYTPELIRIVDGEYADYHVGTGVEELKSVIAN